tara:strand:- start:1572 stop:2711 length:1140 start_codon:yes stop_codon:yes gene_type:complete
MVFHFPPISGGGVVVIVELANKFAQLGHDVTILTPDLDWTGEKYEAELDEKIIIHKIETPSRSNLKIAARRCFDNMKKNGIKLGRQNKYDFIFTIFHPFHLVPKAAVSCAKELDIPVLIKVDDAIYQEATGLKKLQRKIEKAYNSRTLQRGDKILVPNQYTKELIHDYYRVDSNKISIVPNGTELDNFMKSNLHSKQIIFSGAMYHHRGIDVLLDAVPHVMEKIPESRFLLLGDGPEMPGLKEIVEKNNLAKNVIFKGWVDRNKIPGHLSESAIGIGPLRVTSVTKYALPIKVLEYMASSLPILAVKGTLPEQVLKDGENGFIIDNSNDLATKIVQLLDNDELRMRMGQKSREMVTKFDWKDIAMSIIDEFQDISSSLR